MKIRILLVLLILHPIIAFAGTCTVDANPIASCNDLVLTGTRSDITINSGITIDSSNNSNSFWAWPIGLSVEGNVNSINVNAGGLIQSTGTSVSGVDTTGILPNVTVNQYNVSGTIIESQDYSFGIDLLGHIGVLNISSSGSIHDNNGTTNSTFAISLQSPCWVINFCPSTDPTVTIGTINNQGLLSGGAAGIYMASAQSNSSISIDVINNWALYLA